MQNIIDSKTAAGQFIDHPDMLKIQGGVDVGCGLVSNFWFEPNTVDLYHHKAILQPKHKSMQTVLLNMSANQTHPQSNPSHVLC